MWTEDKNSARSADEPGGRPVLVIGKIRRIMDCFSPASPSLTLQQIREGSRLPHTTCLRLLSSLVREGFLQRDGRRYRPGFRLLYWSAAVTSGLGLLTKARPLLEDLRDRTGETAYLQVRDGLRRTCVDLAETRHPIVRLVHVGKVMPVTVGSAGKVFLAYGPALLNEVLRRRIPAYTPKTITDPAHLRREIEAVRARGLAVSFEEREPGAASISAPVFDQTGEVVAAIGIAGPAERFRIADLDAWGREVRSAAKRLSSLMGYVGSPDDVRDASNPRAREGTLQ